MYCHTFSICSTLFFEHSNMYTFGKAPSQKTIKKKLTYYNILYSYSQNIALQHSVKRTQSSTFKIFKLFYLRSCCKEFQLFEHLRRFPVHFCTTAAASLLFTLLNERVQTCKVHSHGEVNSSYWRTLGSKDSWKKILLCDGWFPHSTSKSGLITLAFKLMSGSTGWQV